MFLVHQHAGSGLHENSLLRQLGEHLSGLLSVLIGSYQLIGRRNLDSRLFVDILHVCHHLGGLIGVADCKSCHRYDASLDSDNLPLLQLRYQGLCLLSAL